MLVETVESTGLSIVIPAWNEEKRLGPTLDRYLPALEACGVPFEVVVVSDGANNRSGDVASLYRHRNVRVLRFPMRLGKGGAVLRGIQASLYECVGYVDADGPVLPEDLISLANGLKVFDSVVASRMIHGSRVVNPEPRLRRFAGGVWGSLVRSVLFLQIHDTQCGAKFFRKSALLPILKEVVVTNWAFDVSLLYHLAKGGRTIHEQAVTWTYDEATHLVLRRAVPRMFLTLIGLRLMNLSFSARLPSGLVERFSDELAAT